MYVASPPPAGLDVERVLRAQVMLSEQDWSGDDEYVHWDKLRHLDPPGSLTHEEWWAAIKWARHPQQRTLPLTDPDGRPFTYATPDNVLRTLHYVDQHCAGEIAMKEVVTADDQARSHYLVNSLMEEAIRSSQLEGAVTSRRVAKELLRSGRKPQDRSERMIFNNYRALRYMREEIGARLTPTAVLELHRIVTDGTLDQPPRRLQALCDFANASDDSEPFVHPVVRAVLLHFWLAYDHPFEDGNGRTARALFYWFMSERGYWLVEYLSISRILRDAPSQYAKAFLLTETDDRDTTYFLLHQLGVVRRAIEELHSYLERKTAEIRDVERLLTGSSAFNHRQLAVLSDALRDPGRAYTYGSHATSHRVTHETARTDLSRLVDEGLLERRRVGGRQYEFAPVANLSDRLRDL